MQFSNTNKHFASDNYSGVHPAFMQALQVANQGHVAAYGDDYFTHELQRLIKQHFGDKAQGYPVFNGTGANVLGLQSLLPRWGAIICASSAHIHTDESNAPQVVGGCKLMLIDAIDGKLTPELIAKEAHGFGNEHRSQPAVVYISQATECGTCYSLDELSNLADATHRYGMKLFVDGARLSNAVCHLNTDFRTMIAETGVDMISLGGTKNGMMFGECLIDVTGNTGDELRYLRKMSMQTASKMRFISAQLITLLEDELYRTLATHSNSMASYLAEQLAQLDGVKICYPVEANSVFAKLPQGVADSVRQEFMFYDWDSDGMVRLMCSFDTEQSDIDAFVGAIKKAM